MNALVLIPILCGGYAIETSSEFKALAHEMQTFHQMVDTTDVKVRKSLSSSQAGNLQVTVSKDKIYYQSADKVWTKVMADDFDSGTFLESLPDNTRKIVVHCNGFFAQDAGHFSAELCEIDQAIPVFVEMRDNFGARKVYEIQPTAQFAFEF